MATYVSKFTGAQIDQRLEMAEQVPNKADCITLSTFSSHAGHDDLIKYGSSLLTNKLILVHGSEESKNCLKEKLKIAISKNSV